MSDVRPFTSADAADWVALSNLVLNRRNTVETLLAEDARRDPGHLMKRWVTVDGQNVVAGATLHFWPFDPPGYLHSSVFVHPDWRGQGLGQSLWQAVQNAAQQSGPTGLVTDVSDAQPESVAWAERHGFCTQTHRFASELNLTNFDETLHLAALQRATAQGVTFINLQGADETTMQRYLNFVAARLSETPDLAGHPRWSLGEVETFLHLDHDPHPEWLILAVSPAGEWLGTTAMIHFPHAQMAYNELTATHPQARGRGLALPLKLQAIRLAQQAGLLVMRTNNHSQNARMLAVNRRLGFVPKSGKFEMHLPPKTSV